MTSTPEAFYALDVSAEVETGERMARDIQVRISELQTWHHDQATHRLARHFEFKDFEAALACLEDLARHVWERVGRERMPGFEPLLELQGLKVRIFISGSDDGLRVSDLDLAESIEELMDHVGKAE